MQYVVAISNEYFESGDIQIIWKYDDEVVRFVRKFYDFPEDIITVDDLITYYENDGKFIEINGSTRITIATPRHGSAIFVL